MPFGPEFSEVAEITDAPAFGPEFTEIAEMLLATSSPLLDEPVDMTPASTSSPLVDEPIDFIPAGTTSPLVDEPIDFIPASTTSTLADELVEFLPFVASAPLEQALVLSQPIVASPPLEQALAIIGLVASPPLEEVLVLTQGNQASPPLEGELDLQAAILCEDIIPAGFSLRRGYEGPQIIIEWGDPADPLSVLTYTLVRRRYGYPEDITDGDVIFTGPVGPQFIVDLTVVDCVCYYYKLFVTSILGDVCSSLLVQGEILALETGYFGPKLFEILPEAYKLGDKGLDEPTEIRQALVEGPDDLGEIYNFGEDGSIKRGPLQRVLRLFGPVLDEIKGLIDCFPHQLDVDDACTAELRGLAALLGLKLNEELDPQKMRNEVREQINFLKLKGTIPGIQSRLRSVSGLTPLVREQCERLLITNDPDRTTPGFTISEIANIGGPDDELYYTVGYPDSAPFWLWFTVFVQIPATQSLSLALLRKWCLSVEEGSPTCHQGTLVIETLPPTDTIPVSFTDSMFDETEDTDTMPMVFSETPTDEQIAFSSLWMIVNDTAKLVNASSFGAVVATINVP